MSHLDLKQILFKKIIQGQERSLKGIDFKHILETKGKQKTNSALALVCVSQKGIDFKHILETKGKQKTNSALALVCVSQIVPKTS